MSTQLCESLANELRYSKFDYSALRVAELCLYPPHLPQQASGTHQHSGGTGRAIIDEITEARKRIEESLKTRPPAATNDNHSALLRRVDSLEAENKAMKSEIAALKQLVARLELDIKDVSNVGASPQTTKIDQKQPQKRGESESKGGEEEEEDDVDLFGSDEDEQDDEKERIKQERLKAYAEKKQKKPGPIAKSSVVLDVKPWDDETDMAAIEKNVRSIEMPGLLWGASKLVPLAYGIKKLQIGCVVEDEKVSIDELQERIESFEELVQSVDIAAFNKI